MTRIDWGYACLSLLAGLTLGLGVGLVAHWTLGLTVFIAFLSLHAATEGFQVIPDVPDAIHIKAELLQ